MSNIDPKPWNPTEVRCVASFRAHVRPTSFRLEGRELEVRTILQSWREPEYLYFKVETVDGRVYELRHHEYEDWWQVTATVQGR